MTSIFSLVLVILTARVIPSSLEVSFQVIKSRSTMCAKAGFQTTPLPQTDLHRPIDLFHTFVEFHGSTADTD
jgi:hypothetical protein